MEKSKGEGIPLRAASRFFKISFVSVVALSIYVFFFLPVAALAGDPPHNESSGVFCGSCHGNSLKLFDPQGDPINHPLWETGISSDEAYNAVCLRGQRLEEYDMLGTSKAPRSSFVLLANLLRSEAQALEGFVARIEVTSMMVSSPL